MAKYAARNWFQNLRTKRTGSDFRTSSDFERARWYSVRVYAGSSAGVAGALQRMQEGLDLACACLSPFTAHVLFSRRKPQLEGWQDESRADRAGASADS